MNQCKRVLRALQRHPQGIAQPDFLPPNIIDGGPTITRLAARVKDLRDQGHTIIVDGERYGCALYRLVRAEVPAGPPTRPDRPEKVADLSGGDLSTLFELPARKPSSPYDEAA